ncbi:hypothetical protein [Qipengyuania sediminis]|uniref:hypothetical protein n=1 Tax=Qipengyuania sediminis TaxID=1532023 RepID=UPI00105A7F15|nr:hypothetical protein [Qipengyuania sediminis]
MIALVAAACIAVGACAVEDAAEKRGPSPRSEAPPTEAERRAARLLSLSNNSTLDAKTDPYDRAVLCTVAIEAVQQRLTEAIGMSAEQKQAMAAARGVYQRRAAAAATGARDIRADAERMRTENEDPNQMMRTGVACLRQLA